MRLRETACLGLLTSAMLAGCSESEPEGTRLRGVLGYAEFVLVCDSGTCPQFESNPAFAIGSTFDFDLEVRSDFPYHEAGAHLEVHEGDPRYTEGSQIQTVMAVSDHSDRYLIDYAHIYLYAANRFTLERTDGTPLERDGDVYVLPRSGMIPLEVTAFHDADALIGRVQLRFGSDDTSVLRVSSSTSNRVSVYPQGPGSAVLQVEGVGHTQQFEFRVHEGTRTNPTPSPTRTNPTPDETDTDTGTDTDTSSGGDSSTSSAESSTGGGQ